MRGNTICRLANQNGRQGLSNETPREKKKKCNGTDAIYLDRSLATINLLSSAPLISKSPSPVFILFWLGAS